MTDLTTDTRTVIVDAALWCFRTQGLRRTSVVDIGKKAGVSRSTIYEYFPDKRAIVDAASQYASEAFYRGMARAMDRGASLEEKLGSAAVAVTRARRFIEADRLFDSDEVTILLNRNAAPLLRECCQFLTPYLTAAKLTGEVRKSLDVDAAAEWIARMLFSLFLIPSDGLDRDDAAAVADFVRKHVVAGLTEPGSARRR